jgi:hypothetical protein
MMAVGSSSMRSETAERGCESLEGGLSVTSHSETLDGFGRPSTTW